ncbi:hypothetical protein JHK84_055549 [Glycine max]|nr:hypothetical protein JHK86_055509 [Glycine max]KAG5074318.1 hypothetical protein JHK84_055549 [Glycine max]
MGNISSPPLVWRPRPRSYGKLRGFQDDKTKDPTTDREHGFALTTAKATSSATKAKRIISNVAKPSLHNKSASMTSGLKQSTSASNPPTKDTYPTKDTTSSK